MQIRVDVDDAFALTLVAWGREPGASIVRSGEVDPDADAAALARWARTRAASAPELTPLWAARAWFTCARPWRWLPWLALIIGAFGAGLTASGEFDILTPPLLGLLGWQWLVFGLLAWRAARARSAGPGTTRGAVLALAMRAGRLIAHAPGTELTELAATWVQRAGTALSARITLQLHLAAAAIATGAICGLYLDGLATAYGAHWESTFLGPDQVAAVVTGLLGPAAWLTGIELPDAAGFAAMQQSAVSAAPWIHLWATTLLLFAVLPRVLLAVFALRALRQPLELAPDPKIRQLLAALRGRTLVLTIIPLGYRPSTRSHERLLEHLLTDRGAHVSADRRPPLPWDAEPAPPANPGEEVLVMVNPAQTPEEEVHGPILDALAGDRPLTLALDVPAYAADAGRRASRVQGWQRLASAHGLPTLVLEEEQ